MHLLYSNCVPNITYAAEVKSLSNTDMHKCNVALNDSIRRIFTYNRWESTRQLRLELGYPNIVEIFDSRRRRFFKRGCESRNEVVRSIMTRHDGSVSSL